MSKAEIWNVAILLTQATILIVQLLLTWKINQQAISREKGYFLIRRSNMTAAEGQEWRVNNQYNLKDGGEIGFYAIKADVVLRSLTYSVDGIIYQTEKPVDGFFTEDNRFNGLTVLLHLKEADYKKDYLDIQIIFNLKNTIGYKYTETVDMRFSKIESKIENNLLYHIEKYNMSFDK